MGVELSIAVGVEVEVAAVARVSIRNSCDIEKFRAQKLEKAQLNEDYKNCTLYKVYPRKIQL